MAAFRSAVSKIKPGDRLILANGVWKDAELDFYGQGTKEKPITLSVEVKGKVSLEGMSNLRISGEHIVVEGLVFINGHTPTGEVIAFRRNEKETCNNCRVTECVIDNYNPKERFESDYWVAMSGKNNRFDHNYLVGKRNLGVTLAVLLENKMNQENHHRIDHNYFGYRPILGSNGGETIRIGTSHYSLSNSNTLVEDNYFETCNGEHEIISNKSCQNTFRNNTFYECQGTLTLRHGNETLAENNYFFGNGKANTGGLRIINESQTVKNNYGEGLTGYRFRGALVIMNGVPNSPLNRYGQVKNSVASHNLFVNCDYVQLCAGSDTERTATPINTKMNDNIFYQPNQENIFTVYDDISGITFNRNYLSPNLKIPVDHKNNPITGFQKETIQFVEKNGVKIAENYPNIGPDITIPRPTSVNTGVTWYPKKDYQVTFNTGKTIVIQPGENTIYNAIKKASNGDIIVLSPGKYYQSKSVDITKTITLKALHAQDKPVITFGRTSLFHIENGGSLSLSNLQISGAKSDDYAGNNIIRTSRYSMVDNYKMMAYGCDFLDLSVNHSFSVFRSYKNTFADSILFENCNFTNITGHVLELDKEVDDTGIYNAENVIFTECKYKNVGGTAISLHRGGGDESTFGPILQLASCTFDNVGNDKRNKYQAAVHIHGVQYANMENLELKNSKKINMFLTVGDPVIQVKNSDFYDSEGITSNLDTWEKTNVKVVKKSQ